MQNVSSWQGQFSTQSRGRWREQYDQSVLGRTIVRDCGQDAVHRLPSIENSDLVRHGLREIRKIVIF